MLEPTSAVQRKLRNWQAQLLDLSRANRLLYFKVERASTVPIIRPAPDDLFQALVARGKALVFPLPDALTLIDLDQPEDATATPVSAAAPIADQTALELAAPDQPEAAATPDAPKPTRKRLSNELASSLSDERLSRALFNLRARARAALEEQGVNVLFVAFGVLHWIDPQTKENAQSPLLLVPAALSHEALRNPYTLAMLEDDLVLNPTLIYKLRQDFGLDLPDVPDDVETSSVAAYLDRLRGAIQNRSGWSVSDEVFLGIFSFQKISLYQDMLEHAAVFAAHPMIAALSGDGALPLPPALITAGQLDAQVPPLQVFQVVDADSSQQEAIQAAKQGASFVLQGPPGTGKSQTISNIIAEFLAAGKRVLFVSQKMAALEVVQRRLNDAGLGEFCLQLHNHKRDKREVVKELVDALNAPEVVIKPEYEAALTEVQTTRQKLNAYAAALHTPRFALHQTVFYAHGEMARLQFSPVLAFDVGEVISVNAHVLAQRIDLLNRLVALPEMIDRHGEHPWRGAALRSISFTLRDQLARALPELATLMPTFTAQVNQLAAACGLTAPRTIAAARPLIDFLQACSPRIFALDLDALRVRFTTKYTSIVRGLMGDFRADMQALTDARYAKDKLTYEQAVTLIDQALTIRNALTPVGRGRGEESVSASDTLALLQKIDQAAPPLTEVYGQNPLDQADLAALPAQLAQWRAGLNQLDGYASLNRLRDEAPALKLEKFIEAALNAALPAAQWRDTYLLAFWQTWIDAATFADEALRTFDSRAHTTLIARFKELDRQQLIIARARIRALLSERRPKSSWIEAASAEQTILRREAAKKRRLKPLRKLFAEVPRLITELKPCLLMSPITVAMLLDPEVYTFDLVVFDEASQIAPEEAAGAIVRGVQTIIVGDKMQLPPTRFFEVVGGESGDEETSEAETGRVFDSILEECEGLSLPQKMLLWHYRSRDESLIAFSNHYFYHDRLYTFPNVEYDGGKLGLDFVYVADGVYKRGVNLRRNDVEAKRVVDLIFEHAAKSSDRTLGVIAFSVAQRDAIRIEWERRRREQPQFEAYFDEDNAEPFFIKNLEMVQGDERDSIIFSVGYAKDEAGKLIYNFGPLNQTGGERRLNVAVSRARYHVTLVASLQPEDIDLTRTTSQGAKLLKDYMLIARDGLRALSATATYRADAQADSPFEDEVYRALTARDLTLHRQVGVSGYRIDLAVVDPDQPGRYLLGIECDGATYHSAQTARDRDRLRQQVLESLGWKLLRIWSRDWISDQAREVDRVLAAIEAAKTGGAKPPEPPVNPVVSETHAPVSEPVKVETLLTPPPPVEAKVDLPTYVWPYKRAKLESQTGELGQAEPAALVSDVVRVVKLEGPVHVDEVFDRFLDAWGITRAGRRITLVLNQAMALAAQVGQIDQRGEWLWPIGLEKPIVRAPDRRTPDQDDEPRPIEHIAPEEIAEAALLCVSEARSLSMSDLMRETAQLLGFARNGSKVDEAVAAAIEMLKTSGRIVVEGETVRGL